MRARPSPRARCCSRLDPQKFQIALDNARANLAQVRLNIDAMKADYQAALRDTAAKQQQVNADQATYDRYASLVKQHAVTQQETDDARYKLAADQQAVSASESQARALLAKLRGNPNIAVEDTPAFKQAQARLAEAEREMNHSVVRAPYDGIVTQVNKLQPGMYLGASTAAFGLVSTDHVWVEAEPKETAADLRQERAIRSMSASTSIPAAPGTARCESVAPATDQNFSLLPAENSSGNWVKVVQRIPVRVQARHEARRSAAARRHERRYRHRHRPRPHPVRSVLGFHRHGRASSKRSCRIARSSRSAR